MADRKYRSIFDDHYAYINKRDKLNKSYNKLKKSLSSNYIHRMNTIANNKASKGLDSFKQNAGTTASYIKDDLLARLNRGRKSLANKLANNSIDAIARRRTIRGALGRLAGRMLGYNDYSQDDLVGLGCHILNFNCKD